LRCALYRRKIQRREYPVRRLAGGGDGIDDAIRGGAVAATGRTRFNGVVTVDADHQLRISPYHRLVAALPLRWTGPVRRATIVYTRDMLDHTGIPFLHRTLSVHPAGKPRKTDQYSQEFQVTGSAAGERLVYVAGLYWFREETKGTTTVNFLGPYDPAINGLFHMNTTSINIDADNEAVAAFARLEWAWTDPWRTTLGLELETTWLATDRLLLTLEFTVNDGDIDEFVDTLITIADVSQSPAEGCTRSDLTFLQIDSCPNDRSNENCLDCLSAP